MISCPNWTDQLHTQFITEAAILLVEKATILFVKKQYFRQSSSSPDICERLNVLKPEISLIQTACLKKY